MIRFSLKSRTRALAMLLISFIVITPVFPRNSLTSEEACGKRIYFQGMNCRGNKLGALLGDMEVAGKIQACANCHAPDGKGRPESGQDPGNITWEHLVVPYGHSHQSGRDHPSFTERSFDLAVTKGVDPGQHRLSTLMPRFRMSAQDLTELRAYLKRLSTDFDPGVEDARVDIASVLPLHGPNAKAGQSIRAVLNAYFDEINERGGIYNRRIVLHVAEAPDGPATIGHLSQLAGGPVFAVVAPFAPEAAHRLYSLAQQDDLPVIGSLSLSTSDSSGDSNIFYLSPGLQQLEAELVRFAVKQQGAQAASSAVIWGDGQLWDELSLPVQSIWKDLGPDAPSQIRYEQSSFDGEASARQLRQKTINSIFFIGAGAEALAWMKWSAARNAEWRPQIFLLGPLLKEEVFDAPYQFQDKIYAAYPEMAMEPAATAEFDSFAARHHLAMEHRMLQISAYCASKTFVEALTRTGRELSRGKFIHSLEQLRDFKTGLFPAMSFGPNRRTGSTRIDILCADLQHRQFREECLRRQ